MKIAPTCKTCKRYNKCMEALRFYPCKDYERKKVHAKSKINKNTKTK